MHDLQTETYRSLQTALHFALKGEEMLNRLCSERSTPEDVEGLVRDWREQKNICETIAETLYRLNSDYTHPAFDPSTLDGKGVSYLKTYRERKKQGTLVIPVID